MARQRIQQNSLISGVISPTLLGRTDLEKYYNAVEEAENVVIMPHGGMERRDGLKHLTSVATGSRLFSFEFSVTQKYVLVLSTTDIKIYLPDSGATLSTETWTVTQTQLEEMDIIQSADTVIITHEDWTPRQLQRQGSDTAWAISNITFTNIPKFDYDTTKIPNFFYFGYGLLTDIVVNKIVYFGADTKPPFGTKGYLYKAQYPVEDAELSEIVFAPSATYTNDGTTQVVTLEYTQVVLNSDGNNVNGLDGHAYRPVANLTNVDLALTDYSDTAIWIDNGLWTSLGIRPDVWGTTGGAHTERGYPRTCTFHQGRLWFGGTKSKPTSVFGSVVNNFFDFDTGGNVVQPDDAIFDVLDSDQYNAIQNIVSGSKSLQVITAGGEFTNTADVITPATSGWVRDTGYGGSRVKAVTLDGATYFMDRFRKTVRSFIYDFNEGGHTSPPVSILAEHIISDVQDMDIVRGSSISVSNLLYLVNGDGTVAVFNTMRKENIAGWTKWTTNGLFKRVTVTGDVVSFIVERDSVEYIEVLDNTVLLDHAFKDTSSDRVEVDLLLYNNEIRVVADGITQSATSAILDTGKYYGVADNTASEVYAGMNYDVKIKTLPISANTASEGNFVNIPKRVTQAIVNLYQSRGVYVNGELVTTRQFGENNLDVAVPLATGIERVYLLGYSRKAQVEVTQTSPDPMTLLSLDLEVSY